MTRTAKVFSIVIASPSDVPEERELIANIIESWNYAHAQTRGVILEPIRWETHCYPELGERPQSIVNSQIIDRSDVLIGIFGNQLGTDTGVAPSGTAEEIARFVNAKKPAAVYFSDRPISPTKLNPAKREALNKFQQAVVAQGLVSSFSDLADLKQKVSGDLSRILNHLIPQTQPRPRSTKSSKGYDRPAAQAFALKQSPEQPLIRGDRYTRTDIINSSGDVRIIETWEGVTSFTGKSIKEMPTRFMSRAGHQANWRCDPLSPDQQVSWCWDTKESGDQVGRFVFDPPLEKRSISFVTERFIFNGVSFTKAERMQATDGQEVDEELSGTYKNIWTECIFALKFPEHRFPRTFALSVYKPDGRAFQEEKEFMARLFKAWPEIQTLTFAISGPIVGVKYAVRWTLPDDASSQLTSPETGFVDEVTRRLLGIRLGGGPPQGLLQCLASLRKDVAGAMSKSDLVLSAVLYVYDRQKSGMTCVASLDAPEVEANWQAFFFKPNRGVVGRAFRRRDVEIFPVHIADERPQVFEKVPGQSHEPSCVICIPLFLGSKTDRVMAILSLESSKFEGDLKVFLEGPSGTTELRALCDGGFELIADAIIPKAQVFWNIPDHPRLRRVEPPDATRHSLESEKEEILVQGGVRENDVTRRSELEIEPRGTQAPDSGL